MSQTSPRVRDLHATRRTPRGCGFPRRGRTVCYNDLEWQQVAEAARLCGKPTGRFIRDTSLGARPRVEPPLANAELIRELGRSGTALARLAAQAKATGALPEAASLDAALAQLCDLVRQTLLTLEGRAQK